MSTKTWQERGINLHLQHDTLTYFSQPLEIFHNYRLENLRPDMIAGLSVAVVLLPQAIAYATIAELPPQIGIYAAVVSAIVAALWGSSNHLQTGPTNAASLLVLSTLVTVAVPGSYEYVMAAGLMAIMVGLARLLMGLARLGILVNFVSDSVVIGFTAGAGILISVNQIRNLLGLAVPSSPSLIDTSYATLTAISETNVPSLALGLITILVMIVVIRLKPQWPSALLGMLVASVLVAFFDLQTVGVSVLGELPRSLPPFSLPPIGDIQLIGRISTGALAIAAIGLVEATSVSRSIAARSGQRLDSNQEFVGQGLANIAAGFFSGYTSSGSFTRSAVNYNSGGKTPLASVFSGLWILVALLLFAPLATYIPSAALAGVLIVTSYQMINRSEMKRIWHSSLGDSVIMIATLLGTLLLPLEFAVLAGMIVSFARYIAKTSMPSVYPVVPDANFQHFIHEDKHEPCLQLGVITIGGSLYFGSAQHIEDTIRKNLERHPGQKYLLLRMNLVDHIDISGIHMLEAIARLYRQRKGDIYLIVRQPVMEQMRVSGYLDYLGQDHFLTRENAISTIFHHVLNPSICIYECPLRVFAECQALPKHPLTDQASILTSLPEHEIQHYLPSEIISMLEANINGDHPILIDVREPDEFKAGHIPHANLLPLRKVKQEGYTLPKDQQIILVCRSGRRSTLAAYILKDMGYEQVCNLHGGMLAWEASGNPIAME